MLEKPEKVVTDEPTTNYGTVLNFARVKDREKVDLRANPHKLCNRETCLYHNQPGPNRCDYFYLTNKLRGCKSGDSCTRYERATEGERRKYRNTKIKRYQNSENSL